MEKRSKKNLLTPKEEELMQLLWEHGPISVSRLVELYPEPKPHFNTISTVMRRLEAKGFVAHNDANGSFQYYAVAEKDDIRNKSFSSLIKNYFGGSYYGVVSALVAEEKISAEELKELLDMVERKNKK